MPECANCVRLSKRNRQLRNQLITAQTKYKKSAKEMKALKKQFETNISGIFLYMFINHTGCFQNSILSLYCQKSILSGYL